jgi:TRAP transporter TAXI family solute receptor
LSSRVPGLSATAEATGGSIDNLNLIATGRPYIGFSMADAANDAQMGVGRFLGKKVDLNTLLVLYPNRLHIVTIEGSGIRTLQDLKGRRVSTGAPGSATEVMAVRLLEAAGIDIDNDLRRSRFSVVESANAVKDRQLDAFFWVGGLPTAAITDLANTPRNKIVMIDHSNVVDSMNRKYGNLYFKDVIPRTTYAGMDKDNQSISIANLLVTSSRMNEKDAYDIVKAIFDNKNDLTRTHYEYINVTLDAQRSTNTPIAYHPGVIKYFQVLLLLPPLHRNRRYQIQYQVQM